MRLFFRLPLLPLLPLLPFLLLLFLLLEGEGACKSQAGLSLSNEMRTQLRFSR